MSTARTAASAAPIAQTIPTADLAAATAANAAAHPQTLETIRAIDDFYRRADELYRQTAWRMGLADCAFDILYALVEEDGLTQKQLCERGFSSKQTVHSSIKRLVANDLVALRGDTPRTMHVYLTERGRTEYEGHIRAVLAAECEAVDIFTAEEQRQLTAAMERYITALDGKLAALTFR